MYRHILVSSDGSEFPTRRCNTPLNSPAASEPG